MLAVGFILSLVAINKINLGDDLFICLMIS